MRKTYNISENTLSSIIKRYGNVFIEKYGIKERPPQYSKQSKKRVITAEVFRDWLDKNTPVLQTDNTTGNQEYL